MIERRRREEEKEGVGKISKKERQRESDQANGKIRKQ